MFKKYFLWVFLVLLIGFQLTDYTFAGKRGKSRRPIRQLNRRSWKYRQYEKRREDIRRILRGERTKSAQQKLQFKPPSKESHLTIPQKEQSKLRIKRPERPFGPDFRPKPRQETSRWPDNLSEEKRLELELRTDIRHASEQPLNLISIRNHRFKGKDLFHVHDGQKGFLIDKNFKVNTPDGWKNLIKGGADKKRISDYLDFIDNPSKTECLVINEGSNTNYLKLAISKDALNQLAKSYTKLEERAKQIHSPQLGLMLFETIENVDIVKLCRAGGSPIFTTIPTQMEIPKFISKEISAYDLAQKTTTKELLVQDTGLLNRNRLREGLLNQSILFAKDIDLGIRNCNIRNNPETKISRSDIRVLNFLPRDRKQAKQANLAWSAEQVKFVNESITRLLKANLDKKQILTRELNKKPSFFERIFGKRKERKKEILNKLADVKKQRTVHTVDTVDTVDILISVAHGTKGDLYIPTGEKISVTDIRKMPPNALRNKLIIDLVCCGGLERNKSSRGDVCLKKGARSVLAPDTRLEVSDVLKALHDTFGKFMYKDHFQINEFISEIKKELPELIEKLGFETKKLGLTPFYVPADIKELSILTVGYC